MSIIRDAATILLIRSHKNKKLVLGVWQGLYLFEHKLGSGKRIINHHFIGEK